MSSPLSASNGPAAASRAFDLLAEPVRRWVYDQGWQTLRDAQEAAIPVLLAGTDDVIIAAATAAGKTEAAFLPICSRLESDPARAPGARVLYVAPLKALINDQYDRLSGLCERLEIPVHRWHGDVPASKKSAFLKRPTGSCSSRRNRSKRCSSSAAQQSAACSRACSTWSSTSCTRSSAPSGARSCAACCTAWNLPSAAGFPASGCRPPSAT